MSYAEINKTSSFALKDLLVANVETNCCTCIGVNFLNVLVCGVVVTRPTLINNDKLVFIIDDGTATIKCMSEIGRGPLATRITNMHKNVAMENNTSNQNNVFLNAAWLTATNTTRLLALTDCSDLKLGEKVRITGKLRTFQNVPYIFLQRVERIKKTKQFENYLEQQFCLYDKVYKLETESGPS